MAVLLVITNLPSLESADELASTLIERGLAACVNALAPCRSTYRWQGKLQQDEEYPLLIKTTQEGYEALEHAIRTAHPYELPEIIAVPVLTGLPAYLDWVDAQVPPGN